MRLIPILLGALLFAGCVTTPSPPAQFYRIPSLLDQGAAFDPEPDAPSVGVGPLRLAKYLDRPQLVRSGSDGRLQLQEFDRWAGSLGEELVQVLSSNLAVHLQSEQVYGYPWPRSIAPDYHVELKVARLHADGSRLVLQAHWTLISAASERVLASRLQVIEEPMDDSGTMQIVAAQGRALDTLAGAIADAIRAAAAAP
jgi:uncharacterized lipoprotein YmbA